MPRPTHAYGIPNCDTVKRARAWWSEQGLPLPLHDFRKQGVPPERLPRWVDALGWEALLNTRGTTWRGLPEAERAAVVDAASAGRLMAAHPSAIRRPVIEWDDGTVTVGHDPDRWRERLGLPDV